MGFNSFFVLFFDSSLQARIAHDLKELRDSAVFGFIMINALFVLIVFLLQLNKDNIHVKWPLGVKTNITYDEATQEVNAWRHRRKFHSGRRSIRPLWQRRMPPFGT